jgi:hypothetical protein
VFDLWDSKPGKPGFEPSHDELTSQRRKRAGSEKREKFCEKSLQSDRSEAEIEPFPA